MHTANAALNERVLVMGLGHVGLPLALGLAEHCAQVVGMDVDSQRVLQLQGGRDALGQVAGSALQTTRLHITSHLGEVCDVTAAFVCVPVPQGPTGMPDTRAVEEACHAVAAVLAPGAVVVVESTGFPGMTQGVCVAALEASGLKCGTDFTVAYSPERINPGDAQHTLRTTARLLAAPDAATRERVAALYATVVDAPLHPVENLAAAEAAKLLENAQRDLNIALINEVALILAPLGLSTREVVQAAGTKWNFYPHQPGLVGGPCLGLAAQHLAGCARAVGVEPRVLEAGRAVNQAMAMQVAVRMVKLLVRVGIAPLGARVAVLGCAFKEDIADCRSSGVAELVAQLAAMGPQVLVHDPCVAADDAQRTLGLTLVDRAELRDLDAVLVAVRHRYYVDGLPDMLPQMLRTPAALLDLKWVLNPLQVPRGTVAEWL